MSTTAALFVTGTDTGVGKTVVSVALLMAWRARGRRVVPLKPAESGCARNARGELMPLDGMHLADAADLTDHLDLVCPQRFEAALAPAMAAAQVGRQFDLATVLAARTQLALQAPHDLLLIEGAGGLLVPYADGLLGADLVATFGARLLIVARPGLGTINHTALTVEAARARSLEVVGVIMSCSRHDDDPATAAANAAAITAIAGVRVWGTLPWVAPGDAMSTGTAIATAVDVDALWQCAAARVR